MTFLSPLKFNAFLLLPPVINSRAFKPQLHIYKLSWKVPCSSEAGSWIIQILLRNYRQLGRSCDCDGSTCRTSDYSSFPGSQFASDEEINNNHNANAEDLNNFNSPSNPATIAKAEEEDWHQFEMKRHAIRPLLEAYIQWNWYVSIPTKLKSLVLVLYNSHCLCCTLTLKYFPHPLINKPYVSQAHQIHENSVTTISKPCDSIGMNR